MTESKETPCDDTTICPAMFFNVMGLNVRGNGAKLQEAYRNSCTLDDCESDAKDVYTAISSLKKITPLV